MSQQIQITGGAKVRDLQDVIIGTSGVLSSVAFNVANGVPKLDSNGKILVSQLPNSVMEYLGTWNAATNTPTLANGTGNQGDVWLCTTPGTVNFGAGPITFIVGDSAIYSGSIWQRSGGATGSVTSVGLSTNGGAITIGNSPITTSGTITANFNGTNLQYVNGAGNLTTFPTLITSIGLSMPSAFSVANSPLTANGTIAVTGAGYASQYIRGDGTLADFPSSGGGGSSVSYYLNGGTSQGTIGGTTYYEMSKTADTGTGVDFTKSGDGLIVAFLTDANDPAQLNIPAGNWNYEIYASMSANGGTPQMYAELYKYDGTTFTLISTSTNEILYDGTNLNLYTFGMTVPATTLALTDRLAIKLYATNSGGKTTTIHTQDSHLCQVITTFSTGITALNGLTAQVQYFATGTSGTDFNISSATATHTFNIPDASATARGLITTGTQTIAGSKTFSGIIKGDGGILLKNGVSPTTSGYTGIGAGTSGVNVSLGAGGGGSLIFQSTSYDYTFPAATGTIALTSDIPSLAGYVTLATTQTITGAKTFSGAVTLTSSVTTNNLTFANSGFFLTLQPPTLSVNRTVTLPNATGTLALTTDIPSITGLVPYTGATGDVTLGNFSITGNVSTFKNSYIDGSASTNGQLMIKQAVLGSTNYAGYTSFYSTGTNISLLSDAGSSNYKSAILSLSSLTNNTARTYTLPDASGTIALVGGSGVGTVTSVAALTIGTSGTDLSSSVANSTTTPVITLNVPTASATNRGALSSADWTTFNNKQSALTNPVTGTGTTNYIPKFTGTSTIGNSVIQESSSLIGINVTPTRVLHLSSSGTNAAIRLDNTTSGRPFLLTYDDSQNLTFINSSDSGYIAFNSGTGTSTTKMLLTNSGNLGLGVTPSAWLSTYRNVQIGLSSSIVGQSNDTKLFLNNNAYYSGSSQYVYLANSSAAQYAMSDNEHRWFNAPSGTAGAAITFTQAMTLTASGRLLINTPTESTYQLDVNGTGRFSSSVTAGTDVTLNNGVLYISAGSGTAYSSRLSTAYNYPCVDTYLDSYGGPSWEGRLNFRTNSGNGAMSTKLTIANSGAATFSSSVTAAGTLYLGVDGTYGSTYRTLGLTGTTNGTHRIFAGTSDDLYIAAATGRNIAFWTDGSSGTRMFINTSGNVGIGSTNPQMPLTVQANTGNGAIRLIGTSNASSNNAGIYWYDSNDSTFNGYLGNFSASFDIYNQRSTPMAFYTAATERMRITSGGQVSIGPSGTVYGTNLLNVNGGIYATSSIAAVVASDIDMMVFQNTGATYTKSCLVASMTATGGTGSYFFYGQQSTSTAAIKIFSNGNIQNTNNSYGAISDARLKENIKDATPKLDDLMKVKVRNYNLKGESNKQLGVISQELEAIFPNMIEESTNMGENMKIKGVKYSVFVPMLIKAVQEQQQQINELKQLLNK